LRGISKLQDLHEITYRIPIGQKMVWGSATSIPFIPPFQISYLQNHQANLHQMFPAQMIEGQ
jgi:hypothetical protein